MFLLHGKYAFEHIASGRIGITKVFHRFTVTINGDSLGNEVLSNHFDQGFPLNVLCVAGNNRPA